MIRRRPTPRKPTPVNPSTRLALAAWALIGMLAAPVRADSTIVILRHGEKPARGLGQLNCQGLNRALALAPVLLARYGKPTAIYAPNPARMKTDLGVPYAYIRPLATVEPLAVRAGLPVNLEGGMTDIEPLAAKLLAAPAGTHIVAWEHHWAESLARLLVARAGGNPDEVPHWQDADFDSLFVIRTSEDGQGTRHVTFSHEREGLDGLPASCSEGPLRHHDHGERMHESAPQHP
jgi:hypothetical protein